jgi:hypothetical protein
VHMQGISTKSGSCHYVQVFGMPYPASYHQTQSSIPWPNAQPVFGQIGPPGQSMYNPFIGTPLSSSSAYNNQNPYTAQPREGPYEGPNSNHVLAPLHNLPQGQILHSQPVHLAGGEFYASQQFRGSPHENTQLRPLTNCMPLEDSEGQAMRGVGPPNRPAQGGVQREQPIPNTYKGVRGTPCADKAAEIADVATSTLGRRAFNPLSIAHTTSGIGTVHEAHDSTMEQMQVAHTSNSPILLSSNSSKSSPPYTLSQRKQLRVEEKVVFKRGEKVYSRGQSATSHPGTKQ